MEEPGSSLAVESSVALRWQSSFLEKDRHNVSELFLSIPGYTLCPY